MNKQVQAYVSLTDKHCWLQDSAVSQVLEYET